MTGVKRGGKLKPCGTLAAYRRHERRGEPVDQKCRDAYNAAMREFYAKRKEKR